MRFIVLAALLLGLALPAQAEKLEIDRIFEGGSLSGVAPRGLKVSPDGNRVTFLRPKAQDQHVYDLWVYRPADNSISILVDSAPLLATGKGISEAEESRRERARTAGMTGIIDYEYAPDGSKLLFQVAGTLYLYDFHQPRTKALRPLNTGTGGVIDPKISPEGGFVSFIREQDLWLLDLASGEVKQLTTDGAGTAHNGQAEFVAQEEMARRTGYWWAPDDSLIAFERYDEAKIPVTRRFEIFADHTEVVEQRYPFAGGANVEVRLGLISPAGGEPRWIDLGTDKDIYLTRVEWLPDSKTLSYQWMPRSQQSLELRFVDVATLKQRTVLKETSDTWINLHKDLHFLEQKEAFIWASERSGYHHLYLYNYAGDMLHPISSGEWNIDRLLAVDEANGKVFVSSNRDFVPDRQVYALPLDGSAADAPSRISKRDGWHGAEFADDASIYVDTFSDPLTPPQISVRKPDGSFVAWIEQNKLDESHPYWPYMDSHVVPEYGSILAADGKTKLYYELYKPPGFDPDQRYPVFNTFYGGPHGQQVKRDWVEYFREYMAQQGYIVFTLDNRGMARRGRAFSDVIYHQLGVAEVADQVAGIDWLKQQPWVDDERIGVFGWSYGGYMTVMLLAKDSEDLAGGVAVAPVTDWTLYDTFYTERYLGRPQDNQAGYTRSAVFAWLDGLTSPLYLVHGMADDNVLFLNSTKLMAALQQRGIQFDLMTYPGGKHGLSLPGQKVHVYQSIADYFDRVVKGLGEQATPAPAASVAPPSPGTVASPAKARPTQQ